MVDYYEEKLYAERLKFCYDIAPPRAQQYLQAEIDYVRQFLKPTDQLLELGCGYGRILEQLAPHVASAVGIDTSVDSIKLAREQLHHLSNCQFHEMDAINLSFPDRSFDIVLCLQNGISAFHVDPLALMKEAIRVTRPGGTIFFSSYAKAFWNDRLEWFRLQAKHGLLGEIDENATGDGVIVCEDGFRATTFTADQFQALANRCEVKAQITEVDHSSVFCMIYVPKRG